MSQLDSTLADDMSDMENVSLMTGDDGGSYHDREGRGSDRVSHERESRGGQEDEDSEDSDSETHRDWFKSERPTATAESRRHSDAHPIPSSLGEYIIRVTCVWHACLPV